MTKSIGKAAEFLRKAAAAMRGKAGVLRARLLFLASLRRRAAVVAGISRQIRALTPTKNKGQEKASGSRAMALSRPADDGHDRAAAPAGARGEVVGAVGMADLASLFEEVEEDGDGGHHQDWTLAARRQEDDSVEGLDDGDDEPSVIDIIRSRREGEGKEFRIDDEIDHAADLFITRVRRRRMGIGHRG